MKIDFVKMNGCGNDFIFIDGLNEKIELTSKQVEFLCDRHFGIGADGVIIVDPPINEGSVAFMNYINADGTFAQMCGNGVRCFTKYLVDRHIADSPTNKISVDTRAGVREISYEVDDDGKLVQAIVNMGKPILSPQDVPVNIEANACTDDGVEYVKEAPLDSPWGVFKFTCVSMGNPHAVCFLEDIENIPDVLFSDANSKSLKTFDVDTVGAFFESHPAFPEKTNVEFAVVENDGISMRVYERGCAETLACGTGTCATDVATFLTGKSGRHNIVHLLGGDLEIDWLEAGSVIMRGPAEEVFQGTISI